MACPVIVAEEAESQQVLLAKEMVDNDVVV